MEHAAGTFALAKAERRHDVTDGIGAQPDVGLQHGSTLDRAEALLDERDTALRGVL
jgi:hypothetical protein